MTPLGYPEARKGARELLGPTAEVWVERMGRTGFNVYAIGVKRGRRLLLVGAGTSWEAALEDARKNGERK